MDINARAGRIGMITMMIFKALIGTVCNFVRIVVEQRKVSKIAAVSLTFENTHESILLLRLSFLELFEIC